MDRRPHRESFFFALSTLMFLVVLGGFSRTLYLRPFTDAQDMTGRGIPGHLIVHGLVMTAWFAFVVAQTWLVRSRQVATHRRFGLFGAALGGAVIVTGLYTIAKFVPRAISTQFDPARAADIVVGDTLNMLLFFPALLGAGIWFRNRPQTHRRLMLLASMSISLPVGTRYADMLVLIGWPTWPVAFLTPLTWLVALAVYDKVALGRLHPASIWGGLVLLVALPLPLLISRTSAGHAFVQWVTANV
jgi:hypothetical protein